MGCKALELAAKGSGGVTILAIVQKTCGCSTWGHGLMVNVVLMLCWWLDFNILDIFFNLIESMIELFIQTFYRQRKSVYPPKTAETKLRKWAPLPQKQQVRRQQRKKQAAPSGSLWNRDIPLQRILISNSNLLILFHTDLHHFHLLKTFQN